MEVKRVQEENNHLRINYNSFVASKNKEMKEAETENDEKLKTLARSHLLEVKKVQGKKNYIMRNKYNSFVKEMKEAEAKQMNKLKVNHKNEDL